MLINCAIWHVHSALSVPACPSPAKQQAVGPATCRHRLVYFVNQVWGFLGTSSVHTTSDPWNSVPKEKETKSAIRIWHWASDHPPHRPVSPLSPFSLCQPSIACNDHLPATACSWGVSGPVNWTPHILPVTQPLLTTMLRWQCSEAHNLLLSAHLSCSPVANAQLPYNLSL